MQFDLKIFVQITLFDLKSVFAHWFHSYSHFHLKSCLRTIFGQFHSICQSSIGSSTRIQLRFLKTMTFGFHTSKIVFLEFKNKDNTFGSQVSKELTNTQRRRNMSLILLIMLILRSTRISLLNKMRRLKAIWEPKVIYDLQFHQILLDLQSHCQRSWYLWKMKEL